MVERCRINGYAVDAVQDVDEHAPSPGLEQPILGRAFDDESRVGQGSHGGLHIRLRDDEVHVVGGFRCAVGP